MFKTYKELVVHKLKSNNLENQLLWGKKDCLSHCQLTYFYPCIATVANHSSAKGNVGATARQIIFQRNLFIWKKPTLLSVIHFFVNSFQGILYSILNYFQLNLGQHKKHRCLESSGLLPCHCRQPCHNIINNNLNMIITTLINLSSFHLRNSSDI